MGSDEHDAPAETPSIWRGHRVRLRPVEPDDWRCFADLGRDDRVARLADAISFPESSEAVRRWTERQATREPRNDRFRWVIEPLDGDGGPVGTINTHSCDRRVGSFSYGIVLAPEVEGKGYASEAIRLVLRYFFDELGYQKADVHAYAFNDGSRRLHERLGFRQEGRLRRMAFTGGRHWDVLAYGLLREEFAAEQAAKLPSFAVPLVEGASDAADESS